MRRGEFLLTMAAAGLARLAAAAPELKFGHRQANMVEESGEGVFDLAKQIPGLSGVELQIFYKGTTLWDKETAGTYRKAAARTGLAIPSLAGIWAPGAGLMQTTAEEHLRKAIQTAEAMHATTILAACFEQNCPRMDREESYGPIVALLQKVSGAARDAGVTVGLETSSSPAEDKKLIDLVGSANVQVYFDLDNTERYAHTHEAVPGIALLGNRIRQVHLKNEDRLLEQAGRVDWAAAVKELAAVGYPGWLVFETSHSGARQCVEATSKNISFVKEHFAK